MNSKHNLKDSLGNDSPKRIKKECSYGENCYRKNPAHFREFNHPHLESIIDTFDNGDYIIPPKFHMQRIMIKEQIDIIVEKKIYVPKSSVLKKEKGDNATRKQEPISIKEDSNIQKTVEKANEPSSTKVREKESNIERVKEEKRDDTISQFSLTKVRDGDYRPMVHPTKRPQDFLKVVLPKGKMAEKHNNSAPYYIFYTTITDSKETHNHPLSITFQEILDISLGELKSSLQINFMVEPGWLLAQYYFAGYSNKKLTILYGEECSDLKSINIKKPHIEAHQVHMANPFGKHHTKMMILCYEDGSLRVVISTANLYFDDWENRTQGLWFSPKCPELPESAMPFEGESPTEFKKSLLKYLNHYHLPQLSYYVERVKRCDFSHINVFLVASVPGGHLDYDWGMTRVGSLLKQHCKIPKEDNHKWDLVAQASSIGSYGTDPKLWLMGDFFHNFCKIQNQSQLLTTNWAKLKLVYPSLENVKQSHDGLLGGGCLPYAGSAHAKQPWLNNFLYQWRATQSHRNKAMPHIKSYTRLDPTNTSVAYYLLTSANISKAAWGNVNKSNAALRISSFEAGVLFLPQFVIKKDFFSIDKGEEGSLYIPYDLPPTKYTADMSAWVSDYLCH